MKKRVLFIPAVMFVILVFHTPVSAEEVRVVKIVPDSHSVYISVIGNGHVEAGGGNIKNGRLNLSRQEAQEYVIEADEGNVIEKLYYNGEDKTGLLSGNKFTAEPITADSRMIVIFRRDPQTKYDRSLTEPDEEYFLTGENGDTVLLAAVLLISLGGAAAVYILRGKNRNK